MSKNSMFFVGLDLGDKFSHLTVLDEEGDLIEGARLPTAEAGLRRRFLSLPPGLAAMEVGAHSRTSSRHLRRTAGAMCPSGRAARSDQLSGSSPNGANRAVRIPSSTSPHRPGTCATPQVWHVLPGRPAVPTCDSCWLTPPITSWARLDRTVISAAGA